MSLPILPIITFIPLAAAILMLALPPERKQAVRGIALGVSLLEVALSLGVYFGYDQAAAVRSLLARQGFVEVATHGDLAGIPRVTLGRWLTLTS